MSKHKVESAEIAQVPGAEQAAADGFSRRRLLRAGLSAAPVVAALKSNTVLAGTGAYCVPASSFASIRAALEKGHVPSHYTTGNPNGKFCQHPKDWDGNCGGKGSHYFHSSTKPNSVNCGFKTAPKNFADCNLKTVMGYHSDSDQRKKLASYLASFYICAGLKGNDLNLCYLTQTQCKDIWANDGAWSPASGVKWLIADTLVYLEYLCNSGQCKM